MTSEEFQEFLSWKSEHEKYKKDIERAKKVPWFIASSLRNAVEQVDGKSVKFKIVSQEHMEDVMDWLENFEALDKTK